MPLPVLGALGAGAAALGLFGAGALANQNQPNNSDSSKVGTIAQFSDDDFSRELKRRNSRSNPENQQNPNPQDGVNLATNGQNSPDSPYNYNSGFNRNQRSESQMMLDDLETRQRRMGTYNLDNQLKKASFDNAYTGAENMLNRYVQMRQTGANVLMNAASQRY